MKTFIYSISILCILQLFSFKAKSQDNQSVNINQCGTDLVHQQRLINETGYAQAYENLNLYIKKFIAQHPNGLDAKSIINIPLVFHEVLSASEQASFPDSRIDEMITMLNRDFSGQNTHSMGAFSPSLKADVGIQFYKATIDPMGNPTNGIEKVIYTGPNWNAGDNGLKETVAGGLDAWDPIRYYNVWVCNTTMGLTGWATFPTVLNNYYGLVIDFEYTGQTGATFPYNDGGNASHLIGHSFNLLHIWDQSGCTSDDGFTDTPIQDIETYGNIAGVLTDACSPSAPGIMYMNFMDYSDDAVLANYTPNQKTAMLALFAPGGVMEPLTQPFLSCNANAGPDISICGLSLNLSAIENVGDYNTHWLPNAGLIFDSINSPNAIVTAIVPGTYNVIWQVTNSIGTTCSDTAIISFFNNPIANAGPDAIACGSFYTLNATPSIGTGTWTIVPPQFATFTPNPGTFNATANLATGFGVYSFVWTESNGICVDRDTVLITFIQPPHSEGGYYQAVCGTFAQLSADTIGSGAISGYWTTNTSGIDINYSGADPLPWNPTVDVSSLLPGFWTVSHHEVIFYWNVLNNSGCLSIDSVKVDFFEIPIANAGLDTSICGKSYDMIGNWSIDNPSGIWNNSPLGPGTANFTPINSPNALVNVTEFGDYYFVWKEMNQGNTSCLDRDTILIHFLTVPTPDAGLDISVCGNCAHIQAISSFSSGSWSCPSGGIAYYDTCGGTYSPNYHDSASVWIRYASENDTVAMYWSEFNGLCYGYDTVLVAFMGIQPAISLVDPADSLVCGATYTLLNAQQPAYGYGYWIDNTIPNTTFSPAPTNPSPTATIDTGGVNNFGYHNFYWITVNGLCRDTSSAVPVNFIEKPIANAGGNYWPGLFGPASHIKTDTVCGYNYQMNAVPSLGTGNWFTTLSWAEFGNTNLNSTTIYNDSLHFPCNGCYSVFNSTIQYFEFIWQETHNVCVSYDTLRLYTAPIPSGEFFVTPPTCPQNNFELIAKTWALPNNEDYGINSFAWNFQNGILDPIILNPSVSDSILVGWNSGSEHAVSLITSNVWGCSSQQNTQQLIEPFSGFISGQLNSSPLIDYSAFKINVYRAEVNSEAHLVTSFPLSTSGEYDFGVPGAGDFYLQAKLVQSENNIPFANSYYSNAFEWANAQTINLTCNDSFNINIPLYGYSPATNGQCRIYGLVRYDGTLAPVENATIYMRYQPNQEPARFEFTDQNGYYSINNVPNGNYKLFVDIPGLPQITNHHILINPNDTVFANVNFIVDTTSINKQYGFGIYADTTGFINVPLNNTDFLKVSVFPIPFNQQLNLSFSLPTTEIISAELFDIQGKTLMNIDEQLYHSGEINLSFPTTQLGSGIYFLKLNIGQNTYIKKITKN